MMYILAIDQGTTSTRAILFNDRGERIHQAQQEFKQHFPHNGWVEHDPEDIWQSVISVCQRVLKDTKLKASDIAAIGITNQRETTLVWDASTSEAIYPAIVWQDRRTSKRCQSLFNQGHESFIQSKTGLLIDPYFSASKIEWILDEVPGARTRAEAGTLRFGTIDSFLLWRLSGGKVHATDATNASRTSLFNILTQQWDQQLLSLFNIPESLLPEVKDSSAEFGVTEPSLLGGPIPILGIAGDQQAALIGQTCFEPGMVKSTYGTGCFMIANTGDTPLTSSHKLLTTIGYRLNGKVTYALEGSIFIAGAAVQWLRDALKIIPHAQVTESLAEIANADQEAYLVPAFTGLGAPYWDPDARGALLGLTRNTGLAEVVAATLKSVAYQSRDLTEAMNADGIKAEKLRVDGGMVVNNWVMQSMADILGIPIERPKITETTALGAAYLAGLQASLFGSLDDLQHLWQQEALFEPKLAEDIRQQKYQGWIEAVNRIKSR
jgi:glycerol kinase